MAVCSSCVQSPDSPCEQIHLIALKLPQDAAVAVNSSVAAVAVGAERYSEPVLSPLSHSLTFANVVDFDWGVFFALA